MSDRKIVKVATESVHLFDVFRDKTLEEAISKLAVFQGDIAAEYPGMDVTIELQSLRVFAYISRKENDEEYAARKAKLAQEEANRKQKELDREVKLAQQALKVAQNAQLQEVAAQKERALYEALKAKYEGENNG